MKSVYHISCTRVVGFWNASEALISTYAGVVAGSAAEEFGLETGDGITQIMGERWITLEQVVEKVTNKEPILVARRSEDGVYWDITLPEGTNLSTLSFGAGREQVEQERSEKKKDEALYVNSKGGWMMVRSRDRRRGPEEGDVWVSFEEMQQIKQQAAGSEQ